MEEVTSYYSCLIDIELCTCEFVSVSVSFINDPTIQHKLALKI